MWAMTVLGYLAKLVLGVLGYVISAVIVCIISSLRKYFLREMKM